MAVVRRSGAVTFPNNHLRLLAPTALALSREALNAPSCYLSCQAACLALLGHRTLSGKQLMPVGSSACPAEGSDSVLIVSDTSEKNDPGLYGFPIRGSMVFESRMWSGVNDIRKHFDACIACLVYLNLAWTGLPPAPDSLAPHAPLRFLCRPSSGLWPVPCVSFLQGARRAAAPSFCGWLLLPAHHPAPGSGLFSQF